MFLLKKVQKYLAFDFYDFYEYIRITFRETENIRMFLRKQLKVIYSIEIQDFSVMPYYGKVIRSDSQNFYEYIRMSFARQKDSKWFVNFLWSDSNVFRKIEKFSNFRNT